MIGSYYVPVQKAKQVRQNFRTAVVQSNEKRRVSD